MRKALSAIVILLGLATVPGPAAADELDDIMALMTRLMDTVARNQDFLKRCMAYPQPRPGQTIDLCNSADKPGAGLVCPAAIPETPRDSVCEAAEEVKQTARTTGVIDSLLGFEQKLETTIKILYKTSSIIGHSHRPDGRPLACALVYPVRQDEFSVLFAAFQKGDASITVPIPSTIGGVESFVATVNGNKAKRRAVMIGPAWFCLKENHDPAAPRHACDVE